LGSLNPEKAGVHVPDRQVSPVVHRLASLQGFVLLVWTQPVAGLQESSVQGLLSLQVGGVPGAQVPVPSQSSTPLHALVSAHDVPLGYGRFTQPVTGSQKSSVHALLSGHSIGYGETQVPKPSQ
jgi:hypothetical protein